MVRSPRAFMKIADKAVANPSMRWQAVQSTFSRAKALSTRSPFSSSPAGPPIGPASAARPPSRAIATAAFAAHPPLTTKNPLAWTLPSGCGNSSTRNTSSSTMIPAHKMRGARLADDIGAVLDISADNVMGDRNRWRGRQALRVLPIEHQGEFFALEPARVFQFFTIDDDGFGKRLGVAADHDRRGKRPRLGREITHAPASNANLFQDFTADRLFEAFARLGETGQTRPHGRCEASRTPEHASFAGDRQHDDDGIGAREMLGPTGGTIAPPAGLDQCGCCAAIRAEPMPRMPTEQCLGFGQGRQMIRRHHALHRDRAQVGDLKVVARLQFLNRLWVEAKPEPRRCISKPEEHDLAHAAECARLARRKQRVARLAGFEHHKFAPDHVASGLRVFAILLERGIVTAARYGPLEPTGDVAQRRTRAEIGAR